jgi:hypothetical protein
MESPNLVTLSTTEIEDILPYLMGVQWDSAWATHGMFVEAYAWKTQAVGPNRLLDRVVNYCHSWCPLGLRVSCC